MIPNLPAGTSEAYHLRSPSSSGGKDWVCAYVNGEIHVFYGKTSAINNHQSKAGTFPQMQVTARKKIGKGYKEIDTYTSAQGWSSMLNQGSVSKPFNPPPLVPAVNMEQTSTESLQWDF